MTQTEREQGRRQHHRQALGEELAPAEQALAETFRQTLEREEATLRKPAAERREAQLQRKEERNRELLTLLERETAIVQRLRDTLSEAEAERRAIARESTTSYGVSE